MPSSVPVIMQDVIVTANPAPPMRTATARAVTIAVRAARSLHRAASAAAGTVAVIVSIQPRGRKRAIMQIAITRSTRSAASTISTVRSRCRARSLLDGSGAAAAPAGGGPAGGEPAVGVLDGVATVSAPIRR